MLNGVLPKSWSGQTHAALRIMTGFLVLQPGTAKIMRFPMNDTLRGTLSTLPGGMIYFAGIMELVGATLIILGLFTRTTSFIFLGFMAAAYFIARAWQGLYPILNFGELAILYSFVFLWLATAGSGPFSLDASSNREAHT
jgi:putative oxidoreductase